MVTLLGEVRTKLSTYKLKKIFSYHKKTARVIPLMLGMNALNVYQINMYQNLILLYKAHTRYTTVDIL